MNKKILRRVLLGTGLHLTNLWAQHHQTVLGMEPVGYWPADEGSGEVLHDRTAQANHGRLLRVPWKGRLLDFTGAYQWADIPNHSAYQSPAFSIGAWVFVRKPIRGGQFPGREGMTLFGNAYHHSGFTIHTLYDEPVLYEKSTWAVRGGTEGGLGLYLRRDELVDVISGGLPDALGSREGGVKVGIGEWKHILYTFDSWTSLEGGSEWVAMQERGKIRGDTGAGRLYLNGELVKEVKGVPFQPADKRFLVGSDAVWWLQADVSGSLDGSVRDLVMFDRALAAEEVSMLVEKTRPAERPEPLAGIASGVQDSESGSGQKTLPQWIERARDLESPAAERAGAVLAIAAMKEGAASAVPALTELLEGVVAREAARLPQIEDLLRNALIRALLDIAPEDENARRVLGVAFAKPVLDNLDLNQPALAPLRPLVGSGLYMDALDRYRTLELDDLERGFFSQGAPQRDARDWRPNARAYTGATEHKGVVYKMGEGGAWEGVEKISPEDFKAVVARVAEEYPEAASWRNSDDPHLYRVPITRIDADGNEQTVFLEGEDFVIGTNDEKYRGWSITLDNEGFIHVVGGMHNAANPKHYIPGSWEKIGASYDYKDDDYPNIMYWVSKKPEDITSLEFVGQRGNPRTIPVPLGMNYMNFLQDRNGTLYVYGRIAVQGTQCWGLYRYDTETKRWEGLGGFAPDVKKECPDFAGEKIQFASDWQTLETMRWRHDHPRNRVLAWARQPHFYNYIRGWGIKFDPSNRMHLRLVLFGLDENHQNKNRDFYAWSDDGGHTFHRADGTPVELPLTINPGPGNVDMSRHATGLHWDLWISLLRDAGYSIVQW